MGLLHSSLQRGDALHLAATRLLVTAARPRQGWDVSATVRKVAQCGGQLNPQVRPLPACCPLGMDMVGSG
jgi:hypothetical protein